MQQAIINAVPAQITPPTNHHPAHPFSGDLDFGCIRHRSALASTKLSCNDNRLGRDSVALFYSKQWTINDVCELQCIICWCKQRFVTIMWCEWLFASIIDYHDLWLHIITSSSRPGPASKASVPWVHEKYFAPSTPRPSYHDTEATMRRVNERSFHPGLQYFILNITTFFWFWKTTLVIIYL